MKIKFFFGLLFFTRTLLSQDFYIEEKKDYREERKFFMGVGVGMREGIFIGASLNPTRASSVEIHFGNSAFFRLGGLNYTSLAISYAHFFETEEDINTFVGGTALYSRTTSQGFFFDNAEQYQQLITSIDLGAEFHEYSIKGGPCYIMSSLGKPELGVSVTFKTQFKLN